MKTRGHLLEELGANATASPVIQLVDGWLLRCAPGLPFRRSNAALPLGSHTADVAATVAIVEDFYERRGLPPCVQVSTLAPPEIDAYLASRGYRIDGLTDVLVASTSASTARAVPAAGVVVRVTPTLDDEWAKEYGEMHGAGTPAAARVARVRPAVAYARTHRGAATAQVDGQVAGVGFGVYERGWLGVYGMGTASTACRRGVATTLLHALATATPDPAPSHAYLQVETANAPAHALYEKLGFTHEYSYHYRIKP